MREPEGRDCTAHAPQLDAYADGALEPAEAARLEAHLAHCPRCRETLAEIRACKAAVAALPPPVLPPQAIERHLAAALERLRAEPMPAPPLPRIRRLRRHAPLLWRAAAATLLACVLGLALLVGRPPAVGLGWAPGSFAQLRYRPLALEPVARPIAPARPDLGNVAYADTLALSAAGRARLATRGALALEAPSPDALSLYAAARARGTPVLWTADLAVAATARLLADVRAHLERDRLAPALTAVLRGLALQLARLADQLEPGPAREATFEAAAIAHTGLALLGAA
ncbi:MAG: hypothetical protein D6776_03755, partial [Planctomycetota bacterium]